MRSLHELAIRRMFDGERRRLDAFMDEKWTPQFLRNYIGITDIVGTVAARTTVSPGSEQVLTTALKFYLTDTTEAPRAARAVVAAIEQDRKTEPATIRRELDRFVDDQRLEAASNHVTALLGTENPAEELLKWARNAEIRIRAERMALHAPLDEAEQQLLTELGSSYDELVTAQAALTARVQAAAKIKQIQDDALKGLGIDQQFAEVKQKALKVGDGVGKALERLDQLDRQTLGKTKLGSVLRNVLADPPASDSTTTR